MMRRRVERLGRIALQATYWCQSDQPACPVIFASRYGDLGRSIELLQELAQGQPLSPTSFSLSVHNAIGALYSIARGDTGNYSALAAGADTVPNAFVEVAGLLADGAKAVLLIVYDDALPTLYQPFAERVDAARAWACRIVPAEAEHLSLCVRQVATKTDSVLSEDLQVLRFLTGVQAELQLGNWHWQRHV